MRQWFTTALCWLSIANANAQDSSSAAGIISYPRWKVGASVDIVRTVNVGVAYSPMSSLELTGQFAFVYPSGLLKNVIHANDYFYFTGYGVQPVFCGVPEGRGAFMPGF